MSNTTAPKVYNDASEVPVLENWITQTQAAEILGVTGRQTVWKMLFKSGSLREARRVGSRGGRILLLLKREVERLAVERQRVQDLANSDSGFKIPRGERTPAFSDIEDVPPLKDWITLVEAAPLLGITTSVGVYKLVFTFHRLQHLRRLAGNVRASAVLLYEPEVKALQEMRAAEAEARTTMPPSERKKIVAERERRMRMREWLREQGVVISNYTLPTPEQVSQYEAAHPDDKQAI